jgi:hypothetical protein
MRYTKKDAEGRYYIEGANGALENNTRGYTYGEAINHLAELEDALEKTSALSADEKMSGYIRKADLKAELLRRDFYPAIVKNALETIPPVDVVPMAMITELFGETEEKDADCLFDGSRNIVILTEKEWKSLRQAYARFAQRFPRLCGTTQQDTPIHSNTNTEEQNENSV